MFTSLYNAISSLFGNNIDIKCTNRIAGGDINTAFEIMLTSSERVFMKLNKKSNLYHLLNHLNMFGGSYLLSVKRIVKRYA